MGEPGTRPCEGKGIYGGWGQTRQEPGHQGRAQQRAVAIVWEECRPWRKAFFRMVASCTSHRRTIRRAEMLR
jgi:hypothetical protein